MSGGELRVAVAGLVPGLDAVAHADGGRDELRDLAPVPGRETPRLGWEAVTPRPASAAYTPAGVAGRRCAARSRPAGISAGGDWGGSRLGAVIGRGSSLASISSGEQRG